MRPIKGFWIHDGNDIKRTAPNSASHGFTLWLTTLNFVAVFYWL